MPASAGRGPAGANARGEPGAILPDGDGRVINTLALDIVDGQVQTIRAVINPDKLGHLGPVADVWSVLRETQQARKELR